MTDATPRVDEWVDSESVDVYEDTPVDSKPVPYLNANRARQLERELAESAERVRELEIESQNYNDGWDRARRLAERYLELVISAERKLAEAQGALRDIRSRCGSDEYWVTDLCDAALSGAAPEEKKQ